MGRGPLLQKIKNERAPLTVKELAVNGKELQTLGIEPCKIGEILHQLLLHAVVNPRDNEKEKLLRLAVTMH